MKYKIKSLYDNIKLTFFSGTDTNTLQIEGFDRNNFVSLIVNNAGIYSAAITRKVDYTEQHQVQIQGKYPFFGTRRTLETPSTSTSEEKVKTVIEYFDLEIEKHAVDYQQSDYDEMFNSLISKKLLKANAPKTAGINTPYQGYGNYGYGKYYPSYYDRPELDDDEFDAVAYYREKFKTQEPKQVEETVVQGTLFDDEETFDKEFIAEALRTPVLQYKFNEFILEILTGCPIISKWVKTYEIKDSLFQEVFNNFKTKQFTPTLYESFISENLMNRFEDTDPSEFFSKTQEIEDTPLFTLENILIVKMMETIGNLEANDYSNAVLNALRDFYSV